MVLSKKLCIALVFGLHCILQVTLYAHCLDIEKEMIVNIHNNFRRNAGMHCGIRDGLVFMNKLIWDTYLELKARDFATCNNITNNRAINLDIYDDFFGEVNPQVSGWNLAFGHDMSVENLIESWFKQADVYSCEWESCKPQNERCEDFLQLVWSEASRVGCSVNPSCIHDGESGIFLVCYYDKGWTPFKPPFQIGNKCSQCDNGYGFCEDGLCVSGCMNSDATQCECKKSCHHPGIGEGVLHRETCTCACIFGMGHDCEDVCENSAENSFICDIMNTPQECANSMTLQQLYCPANCDYGCRRARMIN